MSTEKGKARQFTFDNETIAILERLRSKEKQKAAEQGESTASVTNSDIVARALKYYESHQAKGFPLWKTGQGMSALKVIYSAPNVIYRSKIPIGTSKNQAL